MQRLQIKTNYIVIPLITIAVALLGSYFSINGMVWYDGLVRPELTPPKWAFPVAWNTIFLLTTISAVILWNKGQESKKIFWFFKRESMKTDYWWIIGLFIANAFLNVYWSFLFFTLQNIDAAFIEMLALEITNISLIILIWNKSKTASLLLLPYAIWVGFATYLTWQILSLN